ncbi:MAG: sialidase family protein [Desulfobacteraceae bacterium]|jgi:sialidase-1
MEEIVYLQLTDFFISGGKCHYRIPVISVDKHGRIMCFANCRMNTVQDSAQEVTLVLRRAEHPDSQWMALQTLFEYKEWFGGIGTATVDEYGDQILLSYHQGCRLSPNSDAILKSNIKAGPFQLSSKDGGKNWRRAPLNIKKNAMGHIGGSHGSSTGITLKYGSRKGRLLTPARFQTAPGEALETLQKHHYNCALYSDDHGDTWQTSGPVQVGTGEGCLVELSDGRIYYNSRAYFLDGRRRIAWSHNGGETFSDFGIDEELTEPISGGCNAGIALYPVSLSDGKDIILFSNPAGENREQMTVRASFDGGQSWPVSRCIYTGPTAYSAMAVNNNGTIYVLYENGIDYPYEKISLARFNLTWLTEG